jgi:hypothetical protein
MSRTLFIIVGCALIASSAAVSTHASNGPSTSTPVDQHASHHASEPDNSLAGRVREATAVYRDLNRAIAAGYQQFGGCVSGPEVGAMGVHFVNGALVDGTLDVNQPEALIYEFKNGVARLLGVEYITPVPAWDASHEGPPLLNGQHFQMLGAPNRYRLPAAIYELHVWAWRENPNGTYVDWNPRVSCDGAE